MLISIATQTNKPLYSLTEDARGAPKEAAKNAALTTSRKFTLRFSLRKQRPLLSEAVGIV